MKTSAGLQLQPAPARYTLPRFLDDVAARHGDRTAPRFEGRSISYAELRGEARRLAKGLVARGVGKGTRVGVLFANRPEWLFATFAASLTGAVVVPINTFATPDELDYVLRHADVAWLLMQPRVLKHAFLDDLLARHPEVGVARPGAIRCDALPQLRGVVASGIESARGAALPWGALDDDGVSDALLDGIADEIHPADESLVIYTSGTTARPKGVVHRQRAAVIQGWRFAELMGFAADDVVYTAYPFFWTAGIAMAIGATLAAGATLVIEETFEPGAALAAAARERATSIQAWPHQAKAMAEHPDAAKHDLSSVRVLGSTGEPWDDASYTWYFENAGGGRCPVINISGGTELMGCLLAPLPVEPLKATTLQGPALGMDVDVFDEGGRPVRGEVGYLVCKNAAPNMTRGFLGDPQRYLDTYFAQFGPSVWAHGDWALVDEDGFWFVTGRADDTLKIAGKRIGPGEVEAASIEHP
ncbi:MAG: AMP-binding protein, partial [Myxococcota bacterium]